MSLSWLKYFVWVALIHTSFQYEGPDGNFSGISNDSTMLSYSAKPLLYNCVCSDKQGKIYNLLPIANNGTRRFMVKSTYKGYRFSYNPCSSFKEGKVGGCQSDVAICWWVRNGGPDTYQTIGKQSEARCHFNRKNKTLVYKSSVFPNRKVKVLVKCDETKINKEDAIFEIVNDRDDWIFQLTHKCGCGDGCPIDPVAPTYEKRVGTTPDPLDPMRIITPVASSAGTAVLILVVFWCLKRRNNDDGNNERQNLLGEGAGDQYENVIRQPVEESNSERRSRPVPVGSSRDKTDVNARSANV